MKKTIVFLMMTALFACDSVVQVTTTPGFPKIPLGDDLYLLADDTESVLLVLELDSAEYVRLAYPGLQLDSFLTDLTRRIYKKFQDDFDFILYFRNDTTTGDLGFRGIHFPVSNAVRGIGRDIFSIANDWGSKGKLQSACYFPDHRYHGVISASALHEIGHQWVAHLYPTYDHENNKSVFHWEICNANGVMGGFKYVRKVEENSGGVDKRTKYQASNTGARNENGSFVWGEYYSYSSRDYLTDESVQIHFNTLSKFMLSYSDIELYLMGLKSAQELRDSNFRLDIYSGNSIADNESLLNGYFYSCQVNTYTIDDIIADFGEREPDASASQKQFKILSVALALKTDSTFYYDEMIKQIKFLGAPIDANRIFVSYNFSQATQGRGSLVVDGIKNSLKHKAIQPYTDTGIKTLNFENFSDQYELPVKSNTTWTANSSESWLTVTPDYGAYDGTVTVAIAANTSNCDRTATITIGGTGITAQTINVKQYKQPDESWELSPTMTATLTGEGVLTIATTQDSEDMQDEYYEDPAPWFDVREKIRSVVIADGITCISSFVFYQCKNLTAVEIPASVSWIWIGAFSDCERLTSFYVDERNLYFSSDDGVLYNKNKSSLVQFPSGRKGSFTIPASVETINYCGFFASHLSELIIPNTVKTIEGMAFAYSKITELSIPHSVTFTFTERLFRSSQINKVNLPNTLTILESNAFRGCENLSSILIPNTVKRIENSFEYCINLRSVNIPNSVTTIGAEAFNGCYNLDSVTIPASVTAIGRNAFDWCLSLKSFTVEWQQPLSISRSDHIFHPHALEHCTLRVPTGTKALYEQADVWKDFTHIVESVHSDLPVHSDL